MMNWKGFGKKRFWPNCKVLPRNFSGVTEESHEKFQVSRSPAQNVNPIRTEYEAGVLPTQPRRSVPKCNRSPFISFLKLTL
jgi:hypothetical protein